jgi:hypothetical protein
VHCSAVAFFGVRHGQRDESTAEDPYLPLWVVEHPLVTGLRALRNRSLFSALNGWRETGANSHDTPEYAAVPESFKNR